MSPKMGCALIWTSARRMIWETVGSSRMGTIARRRSSARSWQAEESARLIRMTKETTRRSKTTGHVDEGSAKPSVESSCPPPPPYSPNLIWKEEADRNRKRRYRSTLSYPLPDSFPHIFRDGKGEELKENVAVTTSLSTDAALSGRLKSLRSTVTRLFGVEDRETLSNELAEMADEYHEGWSSGSDSGEDD